jgi:hypothetical protein
VWKYLVGLHAEAVWNPVCRTPSKANLSKFGVEIYAFMRPVRPVRHRVECFETDLGSECSDVTESQVVCDDLCRRSALERLVKRASTTYDEEIGLLRLRHDGTRIDIPRSLTRLPRWHKHLSTAFVVCYRSTKLA